MNSERNDRIVGLRLFWVSLCIGIAFSPSGRAASVSLATAPLQTATTTQVLPNIMFTLDDSGSMSWDFMPDWVGSDYPRASYTDLYKNAGFNVVYYNPAVTYTPPVLYNSDGTLNTTTYPSKTSGWTSVKYDAFAIQGSNVTSYPDQLCPNGNTPSGSSPNQTCNLTTAGTVGSNGVTQQGAEYYTFVPGEYCTAVDRRSCNIQSSATAAYPIPGNLRWCSNTALTTCQTTRTPTYQYPRIPGSPAKATLTVTGSGSSSTSFSGITINGQQIMSGTSTASGTNSTVATNVASKINACTAAITGSCTIAGYSASTSGSQIIITAPANSGTTATAYGAPTITKPTGTGTKTITAPTPLFTGGVPGSVVYTVIVSTNNSYPYPGTTAKATSRTDCAGSTCTYNEEMTNFANWLTYYHTRMQMMKSGTSRAFKNIDNKFRVGFNTISYTGASNSDDRFLAVDKFELAQKNSWYTKLFKGNPSSSTPLRTALSKVGKLFAKKSGISGAADPLQYSCQQNFAILSTDGYWNDSGTAFSLTGGSVGDMDGGTTPRPMYEGSTASSNSLADIAKYYYDTDLRTSALGNCTGALGYDVCENNVFVSATDNNVKQHLTLFTVGIGADGLLNYQSDYLTATTGDYYNLKNGLGSPVVNWPDPQVGSSEGPYRIDDLWHAAVNGQGQYFSAKNPDDIVNGLNTALASISAKIGSGAAAATSTLNPVAGDNYVYVASYTTVKWYGNLESRLMNLDTGVTSQNATWCVDDLVADTCAAPSALQNDTSSGSNVWYCVTPSQTTCPGGTLVGTDCKVEVNLACTGTLKSKIGALSDSRHIYTKVGGGLGDFTYSNLTAAQRAYFTGSSLSQWSSLTAAQQALASGANMVNFIRGQTGYEDRASNDAANRVFRYREAVLGDAVESQPAYIGKPTFSYTDSGYSTFASSASGRTKAVFLGTNDGMLHAFDATNGQELWAYVPSMVIPNLWKLADKSYSTMHTYYVNGTAYVADIYSGSWKSIIVGSLRGGGRGYFALDVTDPTSPSFLWEFTPNEDSDVGYSFGDAVVTKRKSDGKWVVLVTSGYNNTSPGSGLGYLYVLDAQTGAVLSKIGTGAGSTATPSGLAKISVWADDPERDNTALYAYGGDLLGNVWRFDLTTNSVMKFAELKDGAGVAQPITTRPEISKINDKRVLYVVTGKYLEAADLATTQLQTIYAIKDDNATTTFVNPRTYTSGANKMTAQTFITNGAVRTIGACQAVNFTSDRGFYLNLPDLYTSQTSGISASERAYVDPQLQFGTLLIPTIVPASDFCAPGGYGWFNYIDYKTGCQVVGGTNAGQKTNSPIVGINVVKLPPKTGVDPGSRVKVSAVTSDDPTPHVIEGVKFNTTAGNFTGKRAVWRELVQ